MSLAPHQASSPRLWQPLAALSYGHSLSLPHSHLPHSPFLISSSSVPEGATESCPTTRSWTVVLVVMLGLSFQMTHLYFPMDLNISWPRPKTFPDRPCWKEGSSVLCFSPSWQCGLSFSLPDHILPLQALGFPESQTCVFSHSSCAGQDADLLPSFGSVSLTVSYPWLGHHVFGASDNTFPIAPIKGVSRKAILYPVILEILLCVSRWSRVRGVVSSHLYLVLITVWHFL